MKKWEYKVVSNKSWLTNKWMQSLGKSHWELVAIRATKTGEIYFFKRELKN